MRHRAGLGLGCYRGARGRCVRLLEIGRCLGLCMRISLRGVRYRWGKEGQIPSPESGEGCDGSRDHCVSVRAR